VRRVPDGRRKGELHKKAFGAVRPDQEVAAAKQEPDIIWPTTTFDEDLANGVLFRLGCDSF
jgi:hypothetical protein